MRLTMVVRISSLRIQWIIYVSMCPWLLTYGLGQLECFKNETVNLVPCGESQSPPKCNTVTCEQIDAERITRGYVLWSQHCNGGKYPKYGYFGNYIWTTDCCQIWAKICYQATSVHSDDKSTNNGHASHGQASTMTTPEDIFNSSEIADMVEQTISTEIEADEDTTTNSVMSSGQFECSKNETMKIVRCGESQFPLCKTVTCVQIEAERIKRGYVLGYSQCKGGKNPKFGYFGNYIWTTECCQILARICYEATSVHSEGKSTNNGQASHGQATIMTTPEDIFDSTEIVDNVEETIPTTNTDTKSVMSSGQFECPKNETMKIVRCGESQFPLCKTFTCVQIEAERIKRGYVLGSSQCKGGKNPKFGYFGNYIWTTDCCQILARICYEATSVHSEGKSTNNGQASHGQASTTTTPEDIFDSTEIVYMVEQTIPTTNTNTKSVMTSTTKTTNFEENFTTPADIINRTGKDDMVEPTVHTDLDLKANKSTGTNSAMSSGTFECLKNETMKTLWCGERQLPQNCKTVTCVQIDAVRIKRGFVLWSRDCNRGMYQKYGYKDNYIWTTDCCLIWAKICYQAKSVDSDEYWTNADKTSHGQG